METAPLTAHEERPVILHSGRIELSGTLCVPKAACGAVLFAQAAAGASPRSRFVARHLQEAGLATLLLDCTSAEEEAIAPRPAPGLELPRLAERWISAIDWLCAELESHELPIGVLAIGAGVAPALLAAAQRGQAIGAIVSRGGRPDLAGVALRRVRAPTLLIVGGDDLTGIEHGRRALRQLRAVHQRLFVVPGCRHEFAEPGALATVARLASDWFARHLDAGTRPAH